MCDKEEFAKIRDSIVELQRADAIQSEQIRTLFHTTEQQSADIREQNAHQMKLVKWLVGAIVSITVIAVLALVFGALGEHGFNAVTSTAKVGHISN